MSKISLRPLLDSSAIDPLADMIPIINADNVDPEYVGDQTTPSNLLLSVFNASSYGNVYITETQTQVFAADNLWVDIVLPTTLTGALRASSAGTGSIVVDYTGTPVIPEAGTLGGRINFSTSVALGASNQRLDFTMGVNGAPVLPATPLAVVATAANQTSALIFPVATSIVARTLSDQDVISIMARSVTGMTATFASFVLSWDSE